MLSATREAREQVVRAQVLERGEALAQGAHLVDRQGPAFAVEAGDRLPDSEVARRPGPGPREVAGEEPVGSPLADSRQRSQRVLDLVVGQSSEAAEVEIAAREADGVFGLAAREAEGCQLVGFSSEDADAAAGSQVEPSD